MNVKKFDCFPSDKSRRATVCCGPGNNKTGSHVTEKISKPETKIHHISARVCKIHSLLLLYIKNSSLFLYFLFYLTLGMIIKHLFTGRESSMFCGPSTADVSLGPSK